jgi:4-diphosphocytidyl-2-C-methyl-D-erythritol kinase
MLVFPNCKINLGLHVTAKRPDGFHNIETVFYPISWCDALEVIENKKTAAAFQLSQSGIAIEGDVKSNILYKAWEIIASEKKLPPLSVHLHKHIPMGAGLGGGSADAAYFINLLNEQFQLAYTPAQKLSLAARLGSDCAFFIHNHPVLAEGRGNEFSDIRVDLSAYYILLVYPAVHCNTKEAYEGLVPKAPQQHLRTVLGSHAISNWKDVLVNDFEGPAFKKHPAIQALKNSLYTNGALYAAMSGSGSTVFGIFERQPTLNFPAGYCYYLQKPLAKVL